MGELSETLSADSIAILWVESTNLRPLYEGLMEALGVEVFRTATGVREGLALAEAHAFDLVLIGERLHDGAGLELAARIRAAVTGSANARLFLVATSDIASLKAHTHLWAVDGVLRAPVTARGLRDALVSAG